MEKKSRVYSILNQVISRGGIEAKGPELIFYCPFCDHHKRKLQVNVDSQNWHCWVCDAKGRSVFSLVKKIGVPKSVFTELSQIYSTYTETYGEVSKTIIGNLPKQFKTLIGDDGSVVFLHAKKYLLSRGITEDDIIKYNIGYCIDGEYGGRIIVPSYDANSNLNYFVGRSIYSGKLKYKNPPVSKDIIAFELYINWNEPVVLCEGVFDAIAIKRNAIPLLGKTISQTLLQKLVHNKVPEIILALDADAIDTSVKISQRLMRYGFNVSRIVLADKDPSELGFKKMRKEVFNRVPVNHYELILQRIASGSI